MEHFSSNRIAVGVAASYIGFGVKGIFAAGFTFHRHIAKHWKKK